MKLLIYIFSFLLFSQLSAQTVVKMDMPQQADKPISVVALFDEELPEEIPVVLGIMGYNIDGGNTPYLFEWTLNKVVISTNDVAIFTPKKGDDLVLTIIDNNKCRASTSFNLKVAKLEKNSTNENNSIKIYPTIINNNTLTIELPTTENSEALVRIFDVNGAIKYEQTATKTVSIDLTLAPGVYFVSVKQNNIHKVERIIAQ